MVELLSKYSVNEILIFMVLLAVAFKTVSSFLDWAREKRRALTIKEMKPEELSKSIEKEIQRREEQLQELEAKRAKDNAELREQISEVAKHVNNVTTKIDLLIDSDKDDIKAFITREYHYFCEQKGWIDDYSLDCIEKRYGHYVEEKGNSFISGLMEKIRNLPHTPPN